MDSSGATSVNGNEIEVSPSSPSLSPSPSSSPSLKWSLTIFDQKHIESVFKQLQCNDDNEDDELVSYEAVQNYLHETDSFINNFEYVFNLCDPERLGRVNCEQFTVIMWLVEQSKNGIELNVAFLNENEQRSEIPERFANVLSKSSDRKANDANDYDDGELAVVDNTNMPEDCNNNNLLIEEKFEEEEEIAQQVRSTSPLSPFSDDFVYESTEVGCETQNAEPKNENDDDVDVDVSTCNNSDQIGGLNSNDCCCKTEQMKYALCPEPLADHTYSKSVCNDEKREIESNRIDRTLIIDQLKRFQSLAEEFQSTFAIQEQHILEEQLYNNNNFYKLIDFQQKISALQDKCSDSIKEVKNVIWALNFTAAAAVDQEENNNNSDQKIMDTFDVQNESSSSWNPFRCADFKSSFNKTESSPPPPPPSSSSTVCKIKNPFLESIEKSSSRPLPTIYGPVIEIDNLSTPILSTSDLIQSIESKSVGPFECCSSTGFNLYHNSSSLSSSPSSELESKLPEFECLMSSLTIKPTENYFEEYTALLSSDPSTSSSSDN